ncbi:benzyl alcohol O-benzoyltransferase-like [Papaver somniferum]|uniref:benzyl alcohol O-benzoyltransferase-like n=1 Tax=Papaver somniferum TaxID=3469 RepID=UPI000E704ACB|nr:benzyl alcohol O-benzoyltransferase-like [Papaver somniferum]
MMTPSTIETLVFTTRKKEPELISPSRPTPHEFKYLSDIDDRFRFHSPVIQLYRNNKRNSKVDRKSDPVDVIREAIANALVFYYPFAGRVRESPFGGKLVVECTGEGVMFIEADADICLDQFNNINDLKPPFPCLNELLYLVPGSVDLINIPLLLIQVTRFLCGGFILAVRSNHTISDAQGLKQFLMALGEIARGYESPFVLPVWQRELLSSHELPETPNKECDLFHRTRGISLPFGQNQEVHRTFFFGKQEMISLKKHLPPHLHTCSNFEILTACLWRCRTLAFNLDPKEDVRLFFSVNGRGKDRLNLPEGFYGNALGCGMASSTAENICRNSFEYTLDLVVKSKNKLLNTDTKEDKGTTLKNKMLKSWTDFTTNYALVGNHYFVTDITRARFSEVDYGWGKAVYAGPMIVHHIPNPEDSSFYIPYENSKGEYGIYVPICLRQQFMKRFVVELGRMISEPPIKLNNQFQTSKKPVRSAL